MWVGWCGMTFLERLGFGVIGGFSLMFLYISIVHFYYHHIKPIGKMRKDVKEMDDLEEENPQLFEQIMHSRDLRTLIIFLLLVIVCMLIPDLFIYGL
jgi:uncharacterized membrane protein SpoIIM required for sporulation